MSEPDPKTAAQERKHFVHRTICLLFVDGGRFVNCSFDRTAISVRLGKAVPRHVVVNQSREPNSWKCLCIEGIIRQGILLFFLSTPKGLHDKLLCVCPDMRHPQLVCLLQNHSICPTRLDRCTTRTLFGDAREFSKQALLSSDNLEM